MDIKKLIKLFKKEKCYDYDIIIKDNYIKTGYIIYDIPENHKREEFIFIYYFDAPKIKYVCWNESPHNGDHWDTISNTINLNQEEKDNVDKKMSKYLKASIKSNIKNKVYDIMCNIYIDEKLKQLD